MEIRLLQNIDGARRAEGLTVIIDVFRAFSLECYLFAAGAGRVLPVGAEETARRLKREHPEYVLIGERGGVKLPGFEYGNSPSQTQNADLKGKTVVHTTSAGTQGIVNAKKAEEIVTGSLVNAGAVAEYIRRRNPDCVSIVCMGLSGKTEAPEDTLCGRYIRGILTGTEPDMTRELALLRADASVERFFREETQAVFPAEDYRMCTDVDRFPFVLKVERLDRDVFEVHPVDPDGRKEIEND